MRRKRKRLSFKPAPILWILFLGNLAIGMTSSRLTSIVRVRTEGVRAHDKARIEGILGSIQDIPCYKINGREIETQVMQAPDVEKAEFSRNPFGDALLTVVYRTPAAKIDGTNNLVLSTDGITYVATGYSEEIPSIKVPSKGVPAYFSLMGNFPGVGLAELAVYAHRHYPGALSKISVDDAGTVCLNIGSGRVVLGSCDDLQLKLKTLEQRLQRNPQELEQIRELNLTSPTSPAIVPKKP